MPEGDTVRRTAGRLHAALSGSRLVDSDFRVPAYATVDLAGRTVRETVSRGKHLLTRVDGGLTVHTHLRMEGSWHLYRTESRGSAGPDWQVRLVLRTATWRAVGLRLGVVDVLPSAAEHSVVGHLGPDLLGPDWDEATALRRLLADPGREVGDALLDQRNLAGLGTLWRAESLFLAGVAPRTPVGQLADLPGLVRLARRLLVRAAETGLQVTTGDGRPGREHWVFNRARRPCRRCGTTVVAAEVGRAPYARPAYWCPRCQPGS